MSRAAEESARPAKKFWDKRYELFARFDEGIRMDADSWHSVTPEATARHIARRLGAGTGAGGGDRAGSGRLWLDAFAGTGGSAIQLAINDPAGLVLAIDMDPHKAPSLVET